MLFLLALLLTADPSACTMDRECTLMTSCLGCNRCYSQKVPPPGHPDCAGACAPMPLSCRCVEKTCEAFARAEQHYLTTRQGKQCSLRAASAITAEKTRLDGAAVDVWVSYALDLLPAACIPKDPAKYVKPPVPVCQACGCPETWFFCARSSADPAALKKLGYTVVVGAVPSPAGGKR